MTPAAGGTVLLDVYQHLEPEVERCEYVDHPVDVPAGTVALRLELRFTKQVDTFQLYGALLDPDGAFRGHVQCPGGPGPRRSEIVVAPSGSSWGCLDGPVPAGRWTARVDLDRFVVAGDLHLTVHALSALPDSRGGAQAATGPSQASLAVPAVELPAVELPGWVRGELHTHSAHSDGATSVDRIVVAGRAAGLAFLAVSDHFTPAHWSDVDRLAAGAAGLALLHSIEVTTHYGHSNVHGLKTWPCTYLDGGAWSFDDLAVEVHRQGGLVGVNHPFSGRQAWRRTDAAWAAVDLLEVLNAGQGANNDAAVGLWDRLLGAGHRIIAVAGTDSHDPDTDEGRLGAVATLVRKPEPSERVTEEWVLARLASGDVCVSRGGAVRLTARSGASSAVMGGRLDLDGELELVAEVDTPCSAVLFVLRDGLIASLHPVVPGHHQVAVTDRSGVRAPYRAELHVGSESDQFWASCNRSHASLLSLSNPIWVA